MRIAIGADHGGYPLKAEMVEHARELGHVVEDVGALQYDAADDYPDFARTVAERVAGGEAERGIVLCGSGVGASIVANKVRGVRAGLCHDTYSARQGVEHDDMNVLCLGARVIGPALAIEVVTAFVGARFSGAERHARRLAKLREVEGQ